MRSFFVILTVAAGLHNPIPTTGAGQYQLIILINTVRVQRTDSAIRFKRTDQNDAFVRLVLGRPFLLLGAGFVTG